ncbi:unnamed protein product [Danaus chrysippus]|uniref:(African queen) hypothetical protein n=1 Tax=Danaus chrysippus TaxID=151541 RepID=A0A8J2R0B8_9NEOP|nr:unnamed protein product [Danaus chrysippus]
MDVLWSKERLQKIFSKDSLRLAAVQASGDGAAPMPCCRLCGGDYNLHCFTESYMWEGVEERYDQLLLDCFGVHVLPDCMICERCIRQLRSTQRFRALVYSAFARPPSECSANRSQMEVDEGFQQLRVKNTEPSKVNLYKKSTRTTIDNVNRKTKSIDRKSAFNSNTQIRRMNISCTVCKQRYPMVVPYDGVKKFVCSRCKKNSEPRNICRKCNVILPATMMKDHMELHDRADLRGKSRLFSLPKKASQITKRDIFERRKYYCSQCDKKFTVAQHLAHHVSTVHKHSLDCLCAVCGKDLKTRDLLDRHMRMHTGQPIYQCDVCMRVFKGKRAFQTHYLTHGK